MQINWFVVWLIAASSNDEIRKLSYGEFMAQVKRSE